MSLNNERVREGIINKLKEYDAYIDNELPDYIMVMLANRKTVHQINNDLQLFLGENTNRFTVWLQGMLTLTTRGDLSEGEEEEEGGEIKEEREKASPPKPSIGTKRKRSEERRSSAEAEERSSPPKIIKTTADEYRRSDAGSVRTQRVKVEISPEEGQRSGGGSVRKPKLPESSRDRDLRELIARRRKEKKTHTPHPKTEMVLTADREEESQEGGGMASVVKLVERPRHFNKGGSRLLQRAIQGIGETMSRKGIVETTTKRKTLRTNKAREETARVPLTTSAVPIKSSREKDQESSSDEEVEGNFVDEFREEQQEVDHQRQEVKAPAVAMVKVPPTVVAMVKTPVVAKAKASPIEVDLREYLNKSKERTDANTRFVVTLDGLGDKYRNVDTSQNLESVKGRQGEAVGMEEEDKEEELETGNGRTGGLPERCRFWPNCKNGDSCPFHHPSAPCRLFPKCKYGNKCCFIHPQCKFDARCTRADCPYLHTAPRHLGFSKPQAAPVAPLVYTQNVKPVSSYSYRSRRGASWNPGRSPKFPNKSALTWTPSKSQHISQRQFAVSDDQTTPLPV